MTSQGPHVTKAYVRGISTTDGGVKKFSTDVMPDEVWEGIEGAYSAADEAQSTADTAKSTAEAAQNTAITAKSTAEAAQSTANTAKSTAEAAHTIATGTKTTAEAAQNTAITAKSTAEAAQNTAITAKTTAETAQSIASNVKITMSGCPTMTGLLLKSQQSGSQDRTSLELSTKNSYTSIRLEESSAGGHVLSITRDGGVQDAATAYNPATLKLTNVGGVKGVIIEGLDALIVNSSTSGSSKKFKITVDDTGAITATEVTT